MKKKVFCGIGIAQTVIWVVMLILIVPLTNYVFYKLNDWDSLSLYMKSIFVAITAPFAIVGVINAVVNLLLINRIFTPSISKSEKVRNIIICILADVVLYGFIVYCLLTSYFTQLFAGLASLGIWGPMTVLGVWAAITLLAVFSLAAPWVKNKTSITGNATT